MAAAGMVTATGAAEKDAHTRIFIGGITSGITVADVEKTFSPLGKVSRVELIRRPCERSLAYMDFDPHSEKCLAKLFSTYNGCLWKGGRLKVEKAKEHYMDRLRREWAEATEASIEDHLDQRKIKEPISSEQIKHIPQEKMQLNIFFPKLMKVKALPFKGTGKHKYSFQRIEVPSLPVHFCDCEEHCKPFELTSFRTSTTSESQAGGIEEKELSVMNAVMGKLFGKGGNENVLGANAHASKHGKNSGPNVNDTQFNEREENKEEESQEEEAETDNFVMNIGSAGDSNVFLDALLAKDWGTKQVVQGSKSLESAHEPIKIRENPSKRLKTGANSSLDMVSEEKKIKVQTESNKDENPFGISNKKRSSEILSDEAYEPPRSTEESGMKQNPIMNQSARGTSWIQKSSWKELVGNADGSIFSISHVLPSEDTVKPKLLNSTGSILAQSTKARDVMLHSDERSSKPLEIEASKMVKSSSPCEPETMERADIVPTRSEGEISAPAEDKNDASSKSRNAPIVIGEVCTFMRNADSEKQWTRAKKVLGGYLKKKTNADDSLNSSKDRSRRKS